MLSNEQELLGVEHDFFSIANGILEVLIVDERTSCYQTLLERFRGVVEERASIHVCIGKGSNGPDGHGRSPLGGNMSGASGNVRTTRLDEYIWIALQLCEEGDTLWAVRYVVEKVGGLRNELSWTRRVCVIATPQELRGGWTWWYEF